MGTKRTYSNPTFDVFFSVVLFKFKCSEWFQNYFMVYVSFFHDKQRRHMPGSLQWFFSSSVIHLLFSDSELQQQLIKKEIYAAYMLICHCTFVTVKDNTILTASLDSSYWVYPRHTITKFSTLMAYVVLLIITAKFNPFKYARSNDQLVCFILYHQSY